MQGQRTISSLPESEFATVGGGCFWCLEPIFDELKGVYTAESGYTGGEKKNPTYKDVCSGTTGHAEVVRVTFNPQVLSYKELLQMYFLAHDPTTLNRQGNDVGAQYRSVIFYHSIQQREVAEEVIRELTASKLWPAPIVTEISPAQEFYLAEDYHQEYFSRNGYEPYCQLVIAPKVAKFRKHFANKLKAKAN